MHLLLIVPHLRIQCRKLWPYQMAATAGGAQSATASVPCCPRRYGYSYKSTNDAGTLQTAPYDLMHHTTHRWSNTFYTLMLIIRRAKSSLKGSGCERCRRHSVASHDLYSKELDRFKAMPDYSLYVVMVFFRCDTEAAGVRQMAGLLLKDYIKLQVETAVGCVVLDFAFRREKCCLRTRNSCLSSGSKLSQGCRWCSKALCERPSALSLPS